VNSTVELHADGVPMTGRRSASGAKILATGFALFAMFFGAGNMVFPLYLGANAGSHIALVAFFFLFVGVGTPLLGLIATSLYKGNYWDFFGRLGKTPAFVIITFLMLVIGPFSAAPRTEVITYQSLLPFLPHMISNSWVFSGLFCLVTFVCAMRETKIIDVIGYVITPVKLFCFTLLIVLGVVIVGHMMPHTLHQKSMVTQAISMGYGTMDMLGAFFFATIAVRAISSRVSSSLPQEAQSKLIISRLLKSCMVAGALLGLIYFGFMMASYYHSADLSGLTPDKMLHAVSQVVLGSYGAAFVSICVTFACLATSIALADVTSTYLYEHVVKTKVPRIACMVFVLTAMFLMTQLGFSGIMKVAYPVLKVLYPSLIVLCIVNILHKTTSFNMVKTPVALTALASVLVCYVF
jgi:branched-chain amino acid:cation transporter, LIVCS family